MEINKDPKKLKI